MAQRNTLNFGTDPRLLKQRDHAGMDGVAHYGADASAANRHRVAQTGPQEPFGDRGAADVAGADREDPERGIGH